MKYNKIMSLTLAALMTISTLSITPVYAEETKDSLTIGISSEFSNLAPMTNNIAVSNRDGIDVFALYDPILWFDSLTSELKPWIATAWEVSEDGLEYTLTIRDDVMFHDGTKMTAEDVAFSLNRIPENPITSTDNFAGFGSAEAINDTTVKIHMETPFPAMLNALASSNLVVLSKAYFEEVGEDGYMEHPIGTGPYKFVERVIGGSMTLEAHEGYWGGEPDIKDVTYKIIPDTNAQMLSLESGEVDILYNPSIQNLSRLGEDSGIEWVAEESMLTCYVNWGSASQLGEDENLRKAIASAIDIEGINQQINLGYTKKAECLLAPGVNARPDDGSFTPTYSFDTETAKEFLTESDYKGDSLKLVCVAGSKEENICKVIQGNLQNVGISAEVNAVDGSTYLTVINDGNYDMAIYTTMPSLYDANLLYQNWNPNMKKVQNYTFADKDKLCELAVASTTEMDSEARKGIFAEMTSIINEHCYMMYLYYDVNTLAYQEGLQGVTALKGTNYRVADWSWE